MVPPMDKVWPGTSSETLLVKTRTAPALPTFLCTKWMRPVDGQYQPRVRIVSGAMPNSPLITWQLAAPGALG